MGHLVEPDTIDVSHGVILYLEDVAARFDGFRALNVFILSINYGELRCIIGPDGTGRTTMMDVIIDRTGPRSADVTGRVFFGQIIGLLCLVEPRIAQIGIDRKLQKPTVFEQHTVWENPELAMKADKRRRISLRARLLNDGRQCIEETLGRIHLETEAYRPTGLLLHGQKQWPEIDILLIQQPQPLLLSEPVADMTDKKTMQLATLFNGLHDTRSIMVVERDMEFVTALVGAEGRVTILAEGSVLAGDMLDAIKHDECVIESYLGR